jgi:broad specificity phosphatase PhoE
MKRPRGNAESSEVSAKETLQLVRSIPLQSRSALLIRHSNREEGLTQDPNTALEETWQLTPEGRRHARNFGRKLPPFAHLMLTHTRIARTRDTADEIAAGFRASHPGLHAEVQGVDPALGLTTFYARDMALRDHWKQKLGVQFYYGWLGGQIPSSVLAPAGEAVTDLVVRLRSKVEKSPESSLLIAISHDVYVFAAREILLGRHAEGRPWIGYLDGLLLNWDSGGHLTVRWRNETVVLGQG